MKSKNRAENYLVDKKSIDERTQLFYKYVYPYKNLIFHICIKHTAS